MPWHDPAPTLLIHPNPPFPSLLIQHSICEDSTRLTTSQVITVNLPRDLNASRVILHTYSKCADCFANELDKAGYEVEYKPCVNNECDETVMKGSANLRNEAGRCWVCVFRDKVARAVKNGEYEIRI